MQSWFIATVTGCCFSLSLWGQQVIQDHETAWMVNQLQALVELGKPKDYYHWNNRMAEALAEELSSGDVQQPWLQTWFAYCTQSLFAGNAQVTIAELSQYLAQQKRPYAEILNEQTKPLFELLALAYLRQGEQENCQHRHSPQSCIIPLQPGGFHALKKGSEKAIELYGLLFERYPEHKYKWLLNVAHMTLGQYPNQVPEHHRLTIPHPTEQANFPTFQEVSMGVGLNVNGLSGGVCVEDFNADGLFDVFVTSYGMEDNVQLLLSNGKGGFVNATDKAGLTGIVSGLNCIHADYNNDGFKDVLILRGAWLKKAGKHPNSLLKNNGDGTFTDVTRSSGLLSYHPTQTASWGDFDRDGFVDLFIGNEETGDGTDPCELYRNNGDGTFSEVAQAHGLGGIHAFVKGVTWGDVNNDGWLDLYVSVLGGDNLLFQNKEGQFLEVGKQAGVDAPHYSFPCWFWDVNNDGWEDLFVCGYDLEHLNDLAGEYAKELQGIEVSSEKPRLFINQGDGTFSEQSKAYGIDKTMFGMGANFGDLDNDGYLDFYIGTGAPDFSTIVPNRMFRNVEGKRFEEVTSAGGFGHIQKGHGVAFADLDQDGDQDVYAVMGGAYEGDTFSNVLFENPHSKNNWIVLQLEGERSNRAALGTRIELELNDGTKRYRTVSSGGTFGASPLTQLIGLGKAKKITKMTLNWSGGGVQVLENLKANQKIRVQEGEKRPILMPYKPLSFGGKSSQHH